MSWSFLPENNNIVVKKDIYSRNILMTGELRYFTFKLLRGETIIANVYCIKIDKVHQKKKRR